MSTSPRERFTSASKLYGKKLHIGRKGKCVVIRSLKNYAVHCDILLTLVKMEIKTSNHREHSIQFNSAL